jgi:hypothetical protein
MLFWRHKIGDTFNSAWGMAKIGVKGVWGIIALSFNLVFGKYLFCN